MSPEEAADDWDLPLEAIDEAIRYCETHQELLKQEAEEERYRLEQKGVSLEPTAAR
jgi:predicted ATPase